jgi:FkbM family methyltransferase
MTKVEINGREFQVDDAPDYKDFWGWVRNGRWEQYTFSLLDRYLTPQTTYLDLGAWIGPVVLYAAPLAGRAIAVEPDPVAFQALQRNIALNACVVETLQEAVCGHNGVIELGSAWLGASTTRSNPHGGGGIGAWVEGQSFTTTCSKLSTLVERLHIEGPLFIKMDVEGAEEQILSDLEFFERHKPLLYVSLHPFWWNDEPGTWKKLEQLASIYKHVLFAVNCEPLADLRSRKELIFTDERR